MDDLWYHLTECVLFFSNELRKDELMARRPKAPLSALAVRMKEDLILSGKRPKTVKAYLAAVRQVARYYNTSPDLLTEDQIRTWLVVLADKKKWRSAHCVRSSAV